MFCIIDCNNFWSPTGGGVRRYHLEKINFYKQRNDIKYVFVMNDSVSFTEEITKNTFVEHIEVKELIKNGGYRTLWDSNVLKALITKHQPDVIEVGSPFLLPTMVKSILKRHNLKTKVFGFWHDNFPATGLKRNFLFLGDAIASIAENIGWIYARKNYNDMTGLFVASNLIGERMKDKGMKNVNYLPLGVDLENFSKQSKNEIDSDESSRLEKSHLTLFFAHRLTSEKGVELVIKAYPLLCKILGYEPKLIIAGIGPFESRVKHLAKKHANVNYVGYINDKTKIAKYYSLTDLAFALCEWETFGLSILESYACGVPIIAANDGAAKEHAINSGTEYVLKERNPEYLARLIAQYAQSKNQEREKEKVLEYAQGFNWEKCFKKQLEIYQTQ